MSRIKKVSPVFSAAHDGFRSLAETINRLIDLVQPFDVLSVSAAATCSGVYGVYLVDATAASVTITLPTAASHKGMRFFIKKTDSTGNAVVIDGDGAETIDGAATQSIVAQNVCLTVVSDGTGWWII